MAKRSTKTSPAMPTEDMKWRAQSDANTLKDAHVIMADPSRHGAAKAHAKTEMMAMQKVMAMKPMPMKTPSLNLGKKR